MSDKVFVVRNQLGQYRARSGEWVDGREPQRLLKLRHRDEALNELVELSARDIELRGSLLECDLGRRGEPVVEASEHRTPTTAERSAAVEAAAREQQTDAAEVTDRQGPENVTGTDADARAREPAGDPAV